MNRLLLSLLLILPALLGEAQISLDIKDRGKPENLREINQRLIEFTNEILKEELPESKVLDANYIPVFSENTYIQRLNKLDIQSPIELDYTPSVRRYIDAYAIKHRVKTAKILERSELYFPIFEEYLDKYDLPLELKYLSVIESALDPKAKSRSGAMGLWQFMYHASKMFDLRITSYIDERMDPEKSTEAACKYLQYLHRIFGDWQLALAAYNGGPGVVREAIHRAGGKTDFWEIREFLPKQTQNYVPAFIAANYILNYNKEHNIIPAKNSYPYFRISPVNVRKPISLQNVATYLDLPIQEIEKLNPIYKKGIIPKSELPAQLILPMEKIGVFIDHEEAIYALKEIPKKYMALQKELSSTKGKYCIYHKVKQGEYFHKIAMKYGCTIHNIKTWNQMKDLNIYAGQKLKVWVYPSNNLAQKPKREPIVEKSKILLYTVQQGDSLHSIAEQFKVKSVKELVRINEIEQNQAIKPGMVLKIIKYQ